MKLPVVLLCLCCLALPAQADIWLCVGANDRQSIQDRPCGKGLREKSHVSDSRRSRMSVQAQNSKAQTAGRTPVEVGLHRNKAVICQLLNAEKSDALSQINGSSVAAPGENPQDNLVKIEKQRTRVGCDVG